MVNKPPLDQWDVSSDCFRDTSSPVEILYFLTQSIKWQGEMDGELEVAWFVPAQLFFSCQAILFFFFVSFHLSTKGPPGKFIGGEEGSAEFQVTFSAIFIRKHHQINLFKLYFCNPCILSSPPQQCPLNCPAGPKGPQGLQGVKVSSKTKHGLGSVTEIHMYTLQHT